MTVFTNGKDLPDGPPRPIIPSLLYDRYVTAVYGQSGAGKGYWLVHNIIGPLLAEGQTVAVVACEDRYALRGRLEAYAAFHERPMPLERLWVRDSVNLLNDREMGIIIPSLAELQPTVFIIDPIGLAIGGANENKAETARGVRHVLHTINERAETTSLYVTHIAKSALRSSQRGSGVWRDTADMEIRIEGTASKLTAVCTKWRDGAQWKKVAYSKQEAHGHIVLTSPRQESRSAVYAERESAVLDTLQHGNFTAQELGRMLDIPPRSVQRILDRLSLEGRMPDGAAS